jgi:hypothetical protein
MLEPLARLGYVSKAIIYAIIGALAMLAATRRGGAITDTSGALRVVVAQPFGRTLLIILAIGLCGYAAWRVVDAITDPDREGTGLHGLISRVGNAIRGLAYGALGLEAFRLLRGTAGSRGRGAELWTARVLDLPFGELLVALAGGIAAVHGVFEIIKAARGRDDEKVDWSVLPSRIRTVAQRISRFGVGVRGAIISTLGVFLVRAALTHDPNQAAGSRESMLRLGGFFQGRWFLAVIAAGVIAYAVDQVVHARCRRIRSVV